MMLNKDIKVSYEMDTFKMNGGWVYLITNILNKSHFMNSFISFYFRLV